MSQLRVTQQFANDVITTAVEGGSNYWCKVLSYQWQGRPDTVATILERQEDGTPVKPKRATLNQRLVQAGVNRLLKPGMKVHASHLGRILAAAVDPENSNVDALDADIVIQAGVFGEIIYG